MSLSEPHRRAALNLILKRCSQTREEAREAYRQAMSDARQGLYDDAETRLVAALETTRRSLGPGSAETVLLIAGLADLYHEQSEFDKARPYMSELLSIRKRAAQRPDAHAGALNEYARLLLTCEPVDLRDTKTALSFALEANAMTDQENEEFLVTLSLAYRLTGDTAKAIATQRKAREHAASWSANQAAGPPDAQFGVDQRTAWATIAADAGKEWLDLFYEPPFIAHQVRIRETFNPGAVVVLVLKDEDGREIVRIPVVNTARTAPEWLEVSFDATAVPVQSVRVILDTSRVAGWNEIDAVELVGPTRRAWAEAAYASSVYR